MSVLGMLAIMVMVGFFVMCIIRMTPAYVESLSVRDIISRMAMDPEMADAPPASFRRKIANIFNSNQIYLLKPSEVKVFTRSGKTYIDASYEVRLPVMWRIDAVLKFDDLLYEVGKPDPQPPLPPHSDT